MIYTLTSEQDDSVNTTERVEGENMTKQAQYLIKIDLERIEAVQLLLAHSGIEMDPVDDMVYISRRTSWTASSWAGTPKRP